MAVEYCGQDEYDLSSFHTSTTRMSLINDKFYCNILTTRGVEQSHSVESIVQEVKELVVQGYKEVTLLEKYPALSVCALPRHTHGT